MSFFIDEPDDTEFYLNKKLRETIGGDLINSKIEKEKDIIEQANLKLESNCETLFIKVNAPIINEMYKLAPYNQLFSKLCNHFKILRFNNFKSIIREVALRSHFLYNQPKSSEFHDLISFNNQKDLLELQTITLLMYRPIQNMFELILFLFW